MNNTITVNNLNKKYKNVDALKTINLTLDCGIYGLIGHNGAGKSTLIKLLTLIEKPTSGDITYNDCAIHKLNNTYRDKIGLMPQNQNGYDEFTGLEFLYYMATLKKMKKQDAKNQIEKLLEFLELGDAIQRKLKTYSGGMRQRIMFAQALLNEPKIIIMDEPTAGLDPYERIKLRNRISQIAKNRIVIVATHVMQDIEAIANELILLKQGNLIFKGSNEQLLQQLSNKVFEKVVSEEELVYYQKNYTVSKIIKLNNQFNIRYISDEEDDKHLVLPSLEDAYLYYMESK